MQSSAATNPRVGNRQVSYQHCEWKSGEAQCRYPGTVSHVNHTAASKDPHPGPWYCSLHCRCTDPIEGRDIVIASQSYLPPPYAQGERAPLVDAMAAERERASIADLSEDIRIMKYAECIARVREQSPGIGKCEPGTAWAQKILDRVANGESLPLISIEFAKAALNRTAEPGEDGDGV